MTILRVLSIIKENIMQCKAETIGRIILENRYILQTELEEYTKRGLYPLHMPGHKRRMAPAPGLSPAFSWDMTEVEGVDDLHEADGILAQAMERTAELFGAQRTWYLVGGSTCGILAGIRALAPAGSTVIAARNCHKSVYHAAELNHYRTVWLTPPVDAAFGVYGSIAPKQVEKALRENPDTACVIVTSPTYEGVISDIAGIAEICHAKNVPLFVDEAHGAHLGLFAGFASNALQCGADLCTQSAHKTLPSLTQTAFLHMGKNSLADARRVERELGVFETSSPSYPLLASLDGCTGILKNDGAALFESWCETLAAFDRAVMGLRHLRVMCHGADELQMHPHFFAFDPSKIAVCTNGTQYTGTSLAKLLRERFGFETEMACGGITLAMTSAADERVQVLRFADALMQLDSEAQPKPLLLPCALPQPGRTVMTAGRAVLCKAQDVPFEKAVGCISAEYIWAYPPGIPLTAPGEEITQEVADFAQALAKTGTKLHHSHCEKPGYLHVLAQGTPDLA